MNYSKLFDKFPELETERLWLKQVTVSDIHELFFILNEDDSCRIFNDGDKKTIQETYATIVDFYPGLYQKKEAIVWGLFLKQTNKLIGIRMCYIDGIDKPVEIQGQILSQYRHQGYTFEAYVEIIKFLRTSAVDEIQGTCDRNNVQAIGLLLKLGFEKEYRGHGIEMLSKRDLYTKDLNSENTIYFSSQDATLKDDFHSLLQAAESYFRTNEYGWAMKTINEALAKNSTSIEALFLKAKIVQSTEGNVRAYQIFEEIIEVKPTFAPAYRYMGICLYNIGNRENAIEHWEKAVELGDLESEKLLENY